MNLRPLVRTPYPPPPSSVNAPFYRYCIQSYSYTEQRKVETDVDRMAGIELATLQLRRPCTNRLSYGLCLKLDFLSHKVISNSKIQIQILYFYSEVLVSSQALHFWNKLKRLRIPTGRRQTSWLCTSAVKELSQGLPGTNPASELGISRFQVQHPDHSATLPPSKSKII